MRDDEVEIDQTSGLISILGGKWTTHRAMAEDTIDAVEKYLKGFTTPSVTSHHLLSGSEGYDRNYPAKLASQFHVPPETARHLAEKFGTLADEVLEPTLQNPDLLSRLVPGFPAILAEVLYCIRHEMAVSLEDILARRIGLQLFSWRDAVTAAPTVGRCLADELGWSEAQLREAINEYTMKIDRYLEAVGLSEDDRELKISWRYGFSDVKRS